MALLVDPRQADELAVQALLRLKARAAGVRPRLKDPATIEDDLELWLRTLFGRYLQNSRGEPVPFAKFHLDFWHWLWAVQKGESVQPFVGIWARGAAKSTSAEMGCVALGARQRRHYGLYVCETQDQADDHVQNIATMLESPIVAAYYPDMAARLVGKYGNSRGWRRDRLRTASSFTIDALGLDTATRGVKLDEDRPDFIVLDDVDDKMDTFDTVSKKISLITNTLLPAGSEDLVVLVIQNLVHAGGVVAQLADGRADFLAGRIVSGPHKAIEGLAVEERDNRWQIVGGRATWDGMNLERCQSLIDRVGITAFLDEAQHETTEPAGGMFSHLTYKHCLPEQVPDLVRSAVWVDPAVSDTDQSDACGIQADGVAEDGTLYRLWSWEQRASPLEAMRQAIAKGVEIGASHVGVETDQGGDTWQSVYREACRSLEEDGTVEPGTEFPHFTWKKAGSSSMSKSERAQRMLAKGYETRRIVHVLGTHDVLERALRRFPLKKPFDLVDAAYWGWNDLANPSALLGLIGQSIPIEMSFGQRPPMTNPMRVFRARGADSMRRSQAEYLDQLVESGEEPRRGMSTGEEQRAYAMEQALGDEED